MSRIGETFAEAWWKLMEASAPINFMIATRRLQRGAALRALAEMRARLDALERILNGEDR